MDEDFLSLVESEDRYIASGEGQVKTAAAIPNQDLAVIMREICLIRSSTDLLGPLDY